MKRLKGKSAIITGAAGGTGKAFAKAYVQEGATVAIADINFERAQKTALEIGADAYAIRLDVAVFLASSEADYIVAQTYNVDGGNWMS